MLLLTSMLLLDITAGSLLSEVIIIAAIILILFVILKLGNLLFGLILNSILGLIAIFLVNAIFSLGITYDWLTWIVVAIFGLPAVAVIIILKILGIPI
jgi:inhibitor of the pro-sigma K processing machinery